jgi:parallel beta-helix repeat protein
MEKKIVFVIMTTLMLIMLALAYRFQPIRSNPSTIIVPDDYTTIQGAIDAANNGDTIYVRANTYYESNVQVSKSLILQGENRSTTIVDGAHVGNVFEVTANHVTIKGFTIQNSGVDIAGAYGGIGVYGADYVTVENNDLVSNDVGILLYNANYSVCAGNSFSYNGKSGVYTRYALGNTFANNTVSNNPFGIVLRIGTSNTTILGNMVSFNFYTGIQVGNESQWNNVLNNTVTNNDVGIYVLWQGGNTISHNNV